MRMRWMSVLCLLPLLAGCQNSYHPLKGGVGFMEVPVGSDGFRVSYIGDTDLSVTEARRFALLRAAELAVLRDDPYFQIVSEQIYVSAGTRYWPPTDAPYVVSTRGRDGRTRAYIRHTYDPGYVESFAIPDVEMQVKLTRDGGAPSIPAAYLLRQAQADKIKLSPGVAERMAGLPNVEAGVALPPEPQPTTKPVQ